MAYMHGNKVEICGVNTSRLVTLGEAEKKELLLKARGGDAGARQRLIDGNLRLVLSVIRRFGNRGEDPDDLFQIGCIGLIKAVDNFNTGLDVRFSTYAVPISVRWGKIRDIKNLSVKKLRLSFLTDTCSYFPSGGSVTAVGWSPGFISVMVSGSIGLPLSSSSKWRWASSEISISALSPTVPSF